MNSPKKDEKPLKASHERFAAEIANGASGVAAARAAFPNQTEASATSTAHRLLKRPEIRERIQRRIEEATSLTSNEIIGTLAAQMRSDPMEIFEGLDNPIIDRIIEKQLGHLIKAITIKRVVEGAGDTKMVSEVIRLQFHSAQTAAIELGRIYGLRQTARQNDRDATIRRRLREALGRFAKRHFNGDIKQAKDTWVQVNPDHSKYLDCVDENEKG